MGTVEEVKDDATIAHYDARIAIYDLIDRDDVSYINAGHALAHFEWSVFTYNQVYSLYQFSENLESWCRRVTSAVRENAHYFRRRSDGA